ncbi:peptidoglycan-binding protein [Mesorhizobium sp. CAU 1732]|uniref:peptidoglycan-binding protein n=1 Tax=Mesorhizobium sp. CAU 1732 TaxID=3140358 RepID=UPI00325FE8C8
MTNRQSYLDSMNAGRRRRPSTSLEQLSNTLEELESRISRTYEGRGDYRMENAARRLAGETAPYEAPAHGYAPRTAPREASPAIPSGVAAELSALRAELRHQMGSGLREEFDVLKTEIEGAMRNSAPASHAAELGVEFERLSAMIHKLSQQSDDRQINLLRLEMEQVKAALGKLAREETVQSYDRRWEELDRRWSDIASQVSNTQHGGTPDAALATLTARLEQISDAVNTLPTSVALRSLEDKMKILASSVDQFAHHQDRVGPEALDAIEMRLDEISRAVAASKSAALPATYDPEPFERIEARISSLARQLGEVVEENPAHGLASQLAALSHRVEDIAHRVEMPEQAIGLLAGQLETIVRKLDQGPAMPDLDGALSGLDSRFATLSDMLEQRHSDALVQGQTLFVDLERRLQEITLRIAEHETPSARQDDHLLEAMDARFAELAARLERQVAPAGDDRAMRDLEARLDTISDRLETSTRSSGVDPNLIRSLEAQIADLTAHISQPSRSAMDAAIINPRLEKIEESIAAGRQDVLEAARHAAEEAVRSFAGSDRDGALVAGLVEDLKSLEGLTRKSDDRNAKTFEAIHDTLLKIVDRIGAVETAALAPRHPATVAPRETLLGVAQTPSLEPMVEALPLASMPEGLLDDTAIERTGIRTPAAAAAAAAAEAIRSDAEASGVEDAGGRRSMLGGITKALTARKAKHPRTKQKAQEALTPETASEPLAPSVDVDPPLDMHALNQPLEPGSGAPDLNAIMRRVRDERGQPAREQGSETAKSDFIAAARRAAQAAAAEAEMMKRSPAAKSKASGFSLGGLLKSRRKPVLMGVAAILMALAALQVGKSFNGGSNVAEAPAEGPSLVAEARQLPTANSIETATAETTINELDATPITAAAAPPATARSSLTTAPAKAEDVTTDWLDAAAPLPTAPVEIAALETPADPLEPAADLAPETSEAALAAIPLEAGPVILREAAAEGDPKALYEIGNRYAEAQGVTLDMAKAAEWYAKAADHGLAPSQYRIGNLYEKGIGVTRDIAKAKTWYQLAAAQGNASAMHNLAVLFAMGADGTTDNESAARWFQQAAELGVRDSQFNLGILAAKGVGMPQNLENAYKWFAVVAQAGDKDAAQKRDEIARELRPEQLENARAAAELWRAKPVNEEANAVEIPDSWRESTDTTASVDMKQAVRNVQIILNKNGYSAGAEDGMMGGKTKAALAAFQKDNGMAPTGEIDEPVVKALLARR